MKLLSQDSPFHPQCLLIPPCSALKMSCAKILFYVVVGKDSAYRSVARGRDREVIMETRGDLEAANDIF